MPSDLQITNIKDQANANSAITIASDGQITVNQNNPTLTLGSNASMASSGLTVRNIVQIALGSDQTLANSTTLTTFFSPTYTPKFSGSKVQGNLTLLMRCTNTSAADARKRMDLSFEGSDITNIVLGGIQDMGAYDYGSSGILLHYFNTLAGPLLTTSGTSTITCNCKLKNDVLSSGSEWVVFANNTLQETHFTWIEYK